MPDTVETIYDKIVDYIKEEGGKRSDWYCGITHDVEERLFDYHNVARSSVFWIWHRCSSAKVARTVEKALIGTGYDGGTGGGDSTAVFVYAYRHRLTTKR